MTNTFNSFVLVWGRQHCREILELIKESSLRWFRHVLQMDDGRLPKQIMHWEVNITTQRPGKLSKKTRLKKIGTCWADTQECSAERGLASTCGPVYMCLTVFPQFLQPVANTGWGLLVERLTFCQEQDLENVASSTLVQPPGTLFHLIDWLSKA